MKRLLFLLLILLPSGVLSEPTLIVDIQEKGKARITYEIKDVENIANLTQTIRDPMVQAIVGERMASLFCWAIDDFFIVPQEDRITINVDCAEFAKKVGGTWETEAKNLTNIKPVTIIINLPRESNLISAEPEPDEVRDNSLVWREVKYIPKVVYKEEGYPMGYGVVFLIAIAGIFLILWKRRK